MSFRSLHTARHRTTIISPSWTRHVTALQSLSDYSHSVVSCSPLVYLLSSRKYAAFACHGHASFGRSSAVRLSRLYTKRPNVQRIRCFASLSPNSIDQSVPLTSRLPNDCSPLQPKDIQSSIDNIFLEARDKNAQATLKHRIGVCVSGGPDSMALAYLLKNTPFLYDVQLEVLAFIVDHKARPESTDEAQQVQQNLNDLGIPSLILTAQWPEGQDPSDLTDFESQAREQRYKLIAEAALAKNIRDIFLGHHRDDQAETVLMRIIRKQHSGLNGLQAMPAESAIPCCDGIFGAYESRFQYSAKHVLRSYRLGHAGVRAPLDFITDGGVQLSAPFGLTLYRPLLKFPKTRLIDTCKENNVKYVIDQTNFDPTVTTRNTIRHLYSKHQLPQALLKPKMMELRERAEAEMKHIREAGQTFLKNCTITSFDLRSGTLTVTLPKDPGNTLHEYGGALHAISMLIETVSPLPRSGQQMQVDEPTLRKFYPNYSHPGTSALSTSSTTTAKTFTCRGVMVEQTTSPKGNNTESIQDSAACTSYFFSRQPFRSAESTNVTTKFVSNPVVKSVDSIISHRTHWTQWDNRYWIRLTLAPPAASTIPGTQKDLNNQTPPSSPSSFSPFQLRPYVKSDFSAVSKLAASQPMQSRYNQIVQEIKDAAPEIRTRCTLPILTYKDQIIGFPTFGFLFKQQLKDLGINGDLQVEVRYKAIDWIGYLRGPSPEVTGFGSREKVYDEEKKKWTKRKRENQTEKKTPFRRVEIE